MTPRTDAHHCGTWSTMCITLSTSRVAHTQLWLMPRYGWMGTQGWVHLLTIVNIVSILKCINYIRDNKVYQIPSALQTDSSGDMVQLEQSLAGLVIHDLVDKDVALEYAVDKEQLKAILNANGVE